MDNNEDYNKEFGKYFLDISKLIFGGAVLATIIKSENINRFVVISMGGIATIAFALFGFYLLKNKK